MTATLTPTCNRKMCSEMPSSAGAAGKQLGTLSRFHFVHITAKKKRRVYKHNLKIFLSGKGFRKASKANTSKAFLVVGCGINEVFAAAVTQRDEI